MRIDLSQACYSCA